MSWRAQKSVFGIKQFGITKETSWIWLREHKKPVCFVFLVSKLFLTSNFIHIAVRVSMWYQFRTWSGTRSELAMIFDKYVNSMGCCKKNCTKQPLFQELFFKTLPWGNTLHMVSISWNRLLKTVDLMWMTLLWWWSTIGNKKL